MKYSPLILKIELAIGYAILIAFFGLIIYNAQKEKSTFDELKKDEALLQEKRNAVSSSLLELLSFASQGETLSTWDGDDFKKYHTTYNHVINSLTILKKYYQTPILSNRIDTICSLLESKIRLVNRITNIMMDVKQNEETLQEQISLLPSSVQKPQKDLQSITEQQEKKGLFGFLRKKNAKSVYAQKMERRKAHNSSYKPLTVPEYTTTKRFVVKQKKFWRQLSSYADSLNENNQNINSKIYKLIYDFEQDIITQQEEKNTELSEKRKEIFSKIVFAALFAFILAILFYILIHQSINKRTQYHFQLEESNKKNGELLLSRKNMMLSVSHDIRAPLSNIYGYAELLRQEKNKLLTDEYITHILKGSQYVISLVNNLLDYYRLESGKEEIKEEPFCPETAFNTAIELIRPLIEKKMLGLTKEFEGTNTLLYGDCSHMQRIIVNLLSNAVKFTHTGNIHIGAFYNNEILRFFVKDTGIGISKEKQQIIFEEFERLDQSDNESGLGLGLAIVSKLVSLLKGTLTIESKPGCGSLFEVCLPMSVVDEHKLINKLEQKKELVGIKVLLIDDDCFQLDITRKIFECNGVHCDVCTTTKELIISLRTNIYHILLVDIQMPETDGYGVLKLLRNSNIEQAKTIPVLAVTARAEQDETQFRKIGFCGCLHKPFSISELLVATAQHMKKEQKDKHELNFDMLFWGETDKKSILEWYIQDTEQCLFHLRQAPEERNYEKIEALIHKSAPIWENIHIKFSVEKLHFLSKIENRDWNESLHPLLEEMILSVKHSITFAKQLLEKNLW